MKVLVAESRGFSATAERRLRELGDLTLADLDRAGLLAAARSADVLFVRLRNRVDAEILAAAPVLRAVVSPTTGLDHLDLAALDARGVAVLLGSPGSRAPSCLPALRRRLRRRGPGSAGDAWAL